MTEKPSLRERWDQLNRYWQLGILFVWIVIIYNPLFSYLELIPQDVNFFSGMARTVFDTLAIMYFIFAADEYFFHGGYEKEFRKCEQ